MELRRIFFLLLLSFFSVLTQAQIIATDTTDIIEILEAKKLEFKKLPDGSEVQILAGNVRMKQGTTIFTCDSCVLNDAAKNFSRFW